jgi:hypothetical protein
MSIMKADLAGYQIVRLVIMRWIGSDGNLTMTSRRILPWLENTKVWSALPVMPWQLTPPNLQPIADPAMLGTIFIAAILEIIAQDVTLPKPFAVQHCGDFSFSCC